ncbi:hypothetical protein SUGI_0422230 [Cryptomeria japonica]|uniref:VQ motif-containing protein 25-like n=1 Tax=Cryptomeria japonica TaxID=3369 RepID=UPI002408AB64|nr:VQ motif-containing protein 25-like [Cryptomeria japonica]GLJ22428.1 hypothetical protein SUGI_0422230 [Cryptomeria japonica]
MECKRGHSGRLSTCRSSHVISKSNSSVQQIITPVIRIVHIFEPKFVNTDAANFRDIVQQLTGKNSSTSSKKFKKKKLGPQIPLFSNKELKADHSESPTHEEEEDLLATVLSLCEDQSSSPLPQIMTENDSTRSLDSFFGSFGAFGEMDFFTPFVGSNSLLPEFPIDHTDHFTDTFMPS